MNWVSLSVHPSALSKTGLLKHVWAHCLLFISFSSFQNIPIHIIYFNHCVVLQPQQLCECNVLLPFQSFLLWLLSERWQLPREYRGFHLCVSVWTDGTWLLCFWPLYLWGQGVYLMRETEKTDVFWGQEGVCSDELQQSTIKEQGGKKKVVCCC